MPLGVGMIADCQRKIASEFSVSLAIEEIDEAVIEFERMKQILDGIARDRARFGSWLTTMHEEAQSITEAAELCMKVAPPAAVEARDAGILHRVRTSWSAW